MKVLLDACVWGGASAVLRNAGHEVEAVADWPADPGDEEILNRALQAKQVIVTLDKDFGELAVVAKYGADLASGAIVTAELSRVRVRPYERVEES